MKNNSVFSGKDGEKYAAKLLKKNGYKILDTNYRSRFGEIDIIAYNDEYICFVEVKTRGENSIADPAYFITKSKQQKIIKTAKLFLAENLTELQPRFDAVLVYTKNDKVSHAKYLENAFMG